MDEFILPSGKKINPLYSKELDALRMDASGDLKNSLEEKLGSEWLSILEMEKLISSHIRKKGNFQLPYQVEFAGKEGDSYLFKMSLIIEDDEEAKSWTPDFAKGVYRVTPGPTISLEHRYEGGKRHGRMYKALKQVFKS